MLARLGSGLVLRRPSRLLLAALVLLAVQVLLRAQTTDPAPPDSAPVRMTQAGEHEAPPIMDVPEHDLEAAANAQGEEHEGGAGHADPVTAIVLDLVFILAIAKLFGSLFARFHQPTVLGELVGGVVLGNLLLFAGMYAQEAQHLGGMIGWFAAQQLRILEAGSPIDILARIGVILLLFLVGLESNISDMMKVGLSSLLVAIAGVVAPFILGTTVSYFFLPGQHDILVHVFIGATLCATSVGITARVLQELGRLNQAESRIVLGAAVIDDVLGLIVLAVVAGMINAKSTGQALALTDVLTIILLAVGFLVVAVIGGTWLSPRLFRWASRLRVEGTLLITALLICFTLAGVANLIGLAPIVGAFAAGLLLDRVHYEEPFHHALQQGEEHHLEELLEPIAAFLVPIFFVQMGMSVKLETFGTQGVMGFALLLTVVAIIGKQVCGLFVLEPGLDKLSVGIGMIPRGEVGLIFAAIGRTLMIGGERVISAEANSAVVIMVIITTMITPPVLQWSLRRGDAQKAKQGLPPPPDDVVAEQPVTPPSPDSPLAAPLRDPNAAATDGPPPRELPPGH